MRRLWVVVLALALAAPLAPVGASPEERPTDHVDPFIGTFGSGFVFPGPAAPHGMVQLSPDTEGYFAYTGYLWSDTHIRGFSHVHVQSMGVHMGGNIPFMPTTGAVTSSDPLRYMSRFDHANEEASPGYYRVLLHDYATQTELTAGLRVGMHRYTFPDGVDGNVLMDVGRSVPRGSDPVRPGPHQASVDVIDERTVEGTAATGKGYTVHFAARFDRPFTSFGAWREELDPPEQGVGAVSGNGAGAYASFAGGGEVRVKVGVSFVSREGAHLNLADELPGEDFDFDALRARTRAAWDDALGAIEVDGGTVADERAFYTALYHAQHHPNVFTDADGRYMGHDEQVHTADGYTHYANFSLWDTYRGQMQLVALIAPDRYRDMLRSLLEIHRQQGRLPRWALQNASPDYMMGDPAVISIADGICRGIVDEPQARDLYEAIRHALLEERRDHPYLERGYMGHDESSRGASQTLENAIADFAGALVADHLGEDADRDRLLDLAGNYRNVLDVDDTGFVRPRFSDGSWLDPYHPELPEGYQEGTGWQWSWVVPHDVRGLFDGMGQGRGGDDLVRERLDVHFGTPVAEHVPYVWPEVQKHITLFGIAYYGNQYQPSNEVELHAPYLYNWAGEPWKTQALVRGIQGLYRPTPDGLPGNDDLGTMSSWYVWSALGFYPPTGGAPLYTIGSPVFSEARIRLTDGVFTVRAPGASAAGKYVQGASLDGSSLERTWFTHDAFTAGGSLELEMGPAANRSWGTNDPPPSLSSHPLDAFGCPT